MDQMRKAILELKNGKTIDIDEVYTEIIKCSEERGLK